MLTSFNLVVHVEILMGECPEETSWSLIVNSQDSAITFSGPYKGDPFDA